MTVVKINAITVPPDGGDELARRFAARAGAVDKQDGFEGFELLRPTDGRTTWLVATRWRDEASFEAWRTSPAFGHGHRQAAEGSGQPDAAAGSSGQASAEHRPVAVSSELWSFEVSTGASRPASPPAG
jgi:heme-degrading monooxygenase HmoA